MTPEEIKEYWERVLEKNGLKSLIPVEEYFSADLTEAYAMISFWKREGIIVEIDKKEE